MEDVNVRLLFCNHIHIAVKVVEFIVAPVGRTIYAIFSRIGYCYRIGGDEFAAITTIPVSEADAMMYERKRKNKGLRQ